MTRFLGEGHNTCSNILNALKPVKLFLRKTMYNNEFAISKGEVTKACTTCSVKTSNTLIISFLFVLLIL